MLGWFFGACLFLLASTGAASDPFNISEQPLRSVTGDAEADAAADSRSRFVGWARRRAPPPPPQKPDDGAARVPRPSNHHRSPKRPPPSAAARWSWRRPFEFVRRAGKEGVEAEAEGDRTAADTTRRATAAARARAAKRGVPAGHSTLDDPLIEFLDDQGRVVSVWPPPPAGCGADIRTDS